MIRLYYSNGSTKDIAATTEVVDGKVLVLGTFRVPLNKLDGWEIMPAAQQISVKETAKKEGN